MINTVSHPHSNQSSAPRVDYRLIGKRLKEIRKSLGISQEEAAFITGTSRRTIQRSEGEGLTDLVKLERLCFKYGVFLPDLLVEQNSHEWISAAIKNLGPQAVSVVSALCKSIEANREVQS
ncbi:MAG: helix-turn-helix domain-containing protein [Candidatus Thiodiazotropha endolucinida]|uniref:Helix-turn-helix domain-containing protein n=1 Tax=Candidatus Thiodiazotropha taylori TaxID=2792791 RepID=A0A9E4NJK3_9GAMM|nr:helix-turn-helix domain-containing protein [Candidatus Thiodiazotropha taylori]MCW4236371.1 helix-turn-helix domain-containing protein [Candidatus Thiodiazotropha endolucinida]